MQVRQQERHTLETPEVREIRIQHAFTSQQARRASETPEDAQSRLQRDSERHQLHHDQPLLHQAAVQEKIRRFHSQLASLDTPKCTTCLEKFPGMNMASRSAECVRCSKDRTTPKRYSAANNMDPGPVPSQLQNLTQVEEMLISAVLPIMTLYRLPQGQYGYSGHVVNLPQDISSFARTLPRHPQDLDVIVIRRESGQSHRDFRVRRSVVLRALQWLVANNTYYCNITINNEVLAQLPEDGDLSGLHSIVLSTNSEDRDTSQAEADPYNADLSRSFVPSAPRRSTEVEAIQRIVHQQHSSQPDRKSVV